MFYSRCVEISKISFILFCLNTLKKHNLTVEIKRHFLTRYIFIIVELMTYSAEKCCVFKNPVVKAIAASRNK